VLLAMPISTIQRMYRGIYLSVIYIFLQVCTTACDHNKDHGDGPIVNTDSGPVRGSHYYVPHLDLSGDAYLGIPYAKPPVDDLRFRYPQKIEKWRDVLDATELPNSCYQAPDEFFGANFSGSKMWNPNTVVSEDCLYLNVWIPSTAVHHKGKNLAVLVWIFGGGFYSGTATLDLYDSKILASMNDIIVVSIGYRVGALGFLCLDSENAPGNVGLFDQLMALEWIQSNIAAFGGDRNNVTLWGESAGSASVSLHLISELSRDKFHRAILQSGTANMHWATTTFKEAQDRSKELAINYLKCDNTNDMGELANCLRDVKVEELVEQQWVSRGILQFPFLPVIDNKFLIESPTQALRHHRFKKCPILIGSNLNEGSYFLIYELPDYLTLEKNAMTREAFLTSLNSLFFHYPQYGSQLNSTFLMDAVAFQYTNWLDVNDTVANVLSLDAAIGDCYFVCPLNEFAMSYAAAGRLHGVVSTSDGVLPHDAPQRLTLDTVKVDHELFDVYSYYFTERYASNPWPSWMGVMHGDEVLFTFGHVLKAEGNFTEDERRLSRAIMKYWTNFAKTGFVK